MSFIDKISAAPRIFVFGSGRSGLVGRFFAMRLMHLGCLVFIVGDTTTPAIKSGDLLICISGSGKTPTVVNMAKLALQSDAVVAGISLNTGVVTPLSECSHLNILLDRRQNSRHVPSGSANNQQRKFIAPMGTVFEISTLIYLETVIAEIIQRQQVKESDMKQRHANLE